MKEDGRMTAMSKKRNRVPISCLICRRRKVKCDKRRPVCTGCERNGVSHLCSYIDPPWALEALNNGCNDGVSESVETEEVVSSDEMIMKQQREIEQLQERLKRVQESAREPTRKRIKLESPVVNVLANDVRLTIFDKTSAVIVTNGITCFTNDLTKLTWYSLIKLDPYLSQLWYQIQFYHKHYRFYKKKAIQEIDFTFYPNKKCPIIDYEVTNSRSIAANTCPVINCDLYLNYDFTDLNDEQSFSHFIQLVERILFDYEKTYVVIECFLDKLYPTFAYLKSKKDFLRDMKSILVNNAGKVKLEIKLHEHKKILNLCILMIIIKICFLNFEFKFKFEIHNQVLELVRNYLYMTETQGDSAEGSSNYLNSFEFLGCGLYLIVLLNQDNFELDANADSKYNNYNAIFDSLIKHCYSIGLNRKRFYMGLSEEEGGQWLRLWFKILEMSQIYLIVLNQNLIGNNNNNDYDDYLNNQASSFELTFDTNLLESDIHSEMQILNFTSQFNKMVIFNDRVCLNDLRGLIQNLEQILEHSEKTSSSDNLANVESILSGNSGESGISFVLSQLRSHLILRFMKFVLHYMVLLHFESVESAIDCHYQVCFDSSFDLLNLIDDVLNNETEKVILHNLMSLIIDILYKLIQFFMAIMIRINKKSHDFKNIKLNYTIYHTFKDFNSVQKNQFDTNLMNFFNWFLIKNFQSVNNLSNFRIWKLIKIWKFNSNVLKNLNNLVEFKSNFPIMKNLDEKFLKKGDGSAIFPVLRENNTNASGSKCPISSFTESSVDMKTYMDSSKCPVSHGATNGQSTCPYSSSKGIMSPMSPAETSLETKTCPVENCGNNVHNVDESVLINKNGNNFSIDFEILNDDNFISNDFWNLNYDNFNFDEVL